MTLETVTKEEWDKYREELVNEITENIIVNMDIYHTLLKLDIKYRKEYKNNRIVHQIDYEEGTITYKLNGARKIGFQIPYKKTTEEKNDKKIVTTNRKNVRETTN